MGYKKGNKWSFCATSIIQVSKKLLPPKFWAKKFKKEINSREIGACQRKPILDNAYATRIKEWLQLRIA